MATVYLIHLDQPISHAKHYLGYSSLENVIDRLARHKAGKGARLLQVANERNITYSIIRTWEFATWQEARKFERKLKSQKHTPRLCPVCNRHLCNQENSELDLIKEI